MSVPDPGEGPPLSSASESVTPLVELVVRQGFGAADDHIAEVCGPGDIVITVGLRLDRAGVRVDE